MSIYGAKEFNDSIFTGNVLIDTNVTFGKNKSIGIKGGEVDKIFVNNVSSEQLDSKKIVSESLVSYDICSTNFVSSSAYISNATATNLKSENIETKTLTKVISEEIKMKFVCSPKSEVIYRGVVNMAGGYFATINLDEFLDLPEGTFESLTKNPQVFVCCDTWNRIKGGISGNIVKVSAKQNSPEDVSWMVVAEMAT